MLSNLELNDYSPMKRSRLWKSPIGNHTGLIFTSSGVPLLTLGPQYLYFLASFLISLSIQGLFIISAYHLVSFLMKVTIWICFLTGMVCLTAAGLVNPGIKISQNMKPQDIFKVFNDRSFCRVCEVVRESGCLHCADCDLCIEDRRFHSVAIGKCVGRNNWGLYYGWIGGVILTFSQIVLAVGTSG